MARKKGRIAVILSGCGYLDGSEIREVVLALLYLDKAKMQYRCFAPDIWQHEVINHVNGKIMNEKRNAMVESARITRGDISSWSELEPERYDALIVPGGYGLAKTVSNFAVKGLGFEVHNQFKRIMLGFRYKARPIGVFGLAPVIVLKAIEENKRGRPMLTIGDDVDDIIYTLGGLHEYACTDVCIFDIFNNIASCSAYMRDDAKLDEVAKGIEKVIKKIVMRIKA